MKYINDNSFHEIKNIEIYDIKHIIIIIKAGNEFA